MISGLLKLFYSEIVKSRIKDLTKKEYEIKQQPIGEVSAKVDNILGKALKYFATVVGILIAFNFNIFFGLGAMVILMLYTYYKVFLEDNFKDNIKENMGNIKSNIEGTSQKIVTDNIKPKLNALTIILLIGLFTDFNIVCILSFLTVFVFTIKDLYSNIKNIR
jgi:hypothetical protein